MALLLLALLLLALLRSHDQEQARIHAQNAELKLTLAEEALAGLRKTAARAQDEAKGARRSLMTLTVSGSTSHVGGKGKIEGREIAFQMVGYITDTAFDCRIGQPVETQADTAQEQRSAKGTAGIPVGRENSEQSGIDHADLGQAFGIDGRRVVV